MICCLIMISMQCCCRYYLHPRQKIGCIIQALILSADRDTTPDRMTGRRVTISQEAAGVSSVSPCQLSGRRRVHITRHTSHASWRLESGATFHYFIITYSGQFLARWLLFWAKMGKHCAKNAYWFKEKERH